MLHGGERAREARRPPAHDDYVRVWSPPDAVELSDRVDRLLALRDRIRDEPHPAELAGDEDPRDAGLKGWAEHGNIDAARFGAEDERDRIGRARRPTGPVADTVGRADQLGLALDEAENTAFRASVDAGRATDTPIRVN